MIQMNINILEIFLRIKSNTIKLKMKYATRKDWEIVIAMINL